jgi:hypothetical protein
MCGMIARSEALSILDGIEAVSSTLPAGTPGPLRRAVEAAQQEAWSVYEAAGDPYAVVTAAGVMRGALPAGYRTLSPLERWQWAGGEGT